MPTLQMRDEPWPAEPHRTISCPVCQKSWIPWTGSLLPCHSRCLFTPQEQDELLDDPRTDNALARDLGISLGIIIAVRRNARKRRAKSL